MRARLALVLAALAGLAGCGGSGDDPPDGPPAEVHGLAVVDALTHVERIRARLTAASDVYATGEGDGARQQLATARELWRERAEKVRRGDRVLAREVDVAFGRVEEQMRVASTFDAVRDRLAPLNGQLLDGVREEVAPKSARLDPAVQAGVLAKILDLLVTEYGRGGIAELRHAYGLVVRSQAVAREFAEDLGPRRADVIDALRNLRSRAFPEGAELPASPLPSSEVAERVNGIREALADRFAIPGA